MTPKARKHKQTILGFALLGFGTLLVLVIALIPRFLSKAYDPQTLCLLEVPLQTHVLILVDRTDPLTPLQSVIFRKLLLRERAALRPHAKLSVFTVTDTTGVLEDQRFSMCSPGHREDANLLYENPQQVQRFFERRFEEPLDQVILDLTGAQVAPQSPIYQSLLKVLRRPDFTWRVPQRRLILLSDLMEHTAAFSHYNTSKFEIMLTLAPFLAPLDLDQVDLEVYYREFSFKLPDKAQKHQIFWEELFRASGAVRQRWFTF